MVTRERRSVRKKREIDERNAMPKQAPAKPKVPPSGATQLFVLTKVPASSSTTSVDELNLIATQEMVAPEVAVDPIVEKARDDRLNLLAMKFSGARQSAEYVARLHILTNRLRVLSPAVTAADWQRCEEIATSIADRSAEISALEAELGLA